jgi:pSer/pThr/pTyr-binding forkhead associated (FHA) protein
MRRAVGRWLGQLPPLEHADARWHVDFVPDTDGELQDEQDIVVHSELILPAEVELGSGERTRRLTTVHAGPRTAVRSRTDRSPSTAAACGRLVYQDQNGAHQYDVVKDSTTIGRGGTMYPVDVRVSTTDEVSREHARIRRDPETGALFLIDLSTHGTTIDGRPVPRGFDDADGGKRENGAQMALPPTARIGLANTIFLEFERRG